MFKNEDDYMEDYTCITLKVNTKTYADYPFLETRKSSWLPPVFSILWIGLPYVVSQCFCYTCLFGTIAVGL